MCDRSLIFPVNKDGRFIKCRHRVLQIINCRAVRVSNLKAAVKEKNMCRIVLLLCRGGPTTDLTHPLTPISLPPDIGPPDLIQLLFKLCFSATISSIRPPPPPSQLFCPSASTSLKAPPPAFLTGEKKIKNKNNIPQISKSFTATEMSQMLDLILAPNTTWNVENYWTILSL